MKISKSQKQFIKNGLLFCAIVAMIFVTSSFGFPGEKKPVKPVMSPDQLIKNLKTGKFTGHLRDYHLNNLDVRNVLVNMAKDTGLNIIIKPGIKGDITCDMDSVPWDKALHHFLEQLGLEIKSTGSVLVVQKKEEVSKMPEKPVISPGQLLKNFKSKNYTGERSDFNLKNMDLGNLLEKFAEKFGLGIVTKQGIKGNITCKLDNVPWDEALHFFLEQNGLEMKLDGNMLAVQRKVESQKKRSKPVMSPKQLLKNFKNKKYTGDTRSYHLCKQDLAQLLLHFARDTGLNIFIKSGVQGLVTCELVNIAWDRALHLLLEQNDLEIKLDGSILIIQQKEKYPPM